MRGITTFVLIAAIVAAIIALGGSGAQVPSTPQPPDSLEVEQTSTELGVTVPLVMEGPAQVIIECETYVKIEDQAPDGKVAMRTGTAHLGKAIGYLEIPDGWIDHCGLPKELKEHDQGGALPGKAHYEFEVPREDTYYLYLRAKWFDSCGDSVWIKVGDLNYEGIEDTIGKITETSFRWAWHPLEDKRQLKSFKLAVGKHTLTLSTREDGPQFDKILISTDATAPTESVVDP